MTRLSCPRCRCELDVRVTAEYEDWTEYEIVAVPLRDQPCTLSRGAYEPPAGHIGYVRTVAVGGAVCNWLGPTCNDASHVTPVTLAAPRNLRNLRGAARLAARRTRRRAPSCAGGGLARCVHKN